MQPGIKNQTLPSAAVRQSSEKANETEKQASDARESRFKELTQERKACIEMRRAQKEKKFPAAIRTAGMTGSFAFD